ncbi:MAG: pyrroline-5-carboxylate reductase [Planctomycetota bacterium]|nr:pyrroline-5-carboxylate reductase [Planctomycetota bacterium]
MNMKPKRLVLIGGGQMGRALMSGILSSSILEPSQVCFVDPSEETQQWWGAHYPEVACEDLKSGVDSSDVVLLAVKPNLVPVVTTDQNVDFDGKLVISVAAGISLGQLASWIGHHRVVRVMPNTPSLVREGASGFCCDTQVDAPTRDWIQSLLSCVGLAVEVAETQMDAVTGLSGSGPAYVCLIIEALADGGVQAGLPRPLAMKLATQTVLGTAKMIDSTGRHPGELKDAVASPGGTTIAAIAELEKNAIRGALMQAVHASAERSRQMGK